ncbi:MAG TPA: aspartate ammonia-lyase, partial [Chroococcales cyanobacterium]
MSFRTERDSLGERAVPKSAYYGIETQRAIENYPISGRPLAKPVIRAIAVIKAAMARANGACGKLAPSLVEAIVQAAREVAEGRFDSHFPVDAFQAGAGTCSHMNANEVIANRANEMLGGRLGEYSPIDPHDQVNLGQSTNDVFPSAIRLAALQEGRMLQGELGHLAAAFEGKAIEFWPVLKSGRTHLMDAVPIRLGQEFSGYAHSLRKAIRRIESSLEGLCELGLGGNAVGTGVNNPVGLEKRAIEDLAKMTGFPLLPSPNPFEATQSVAPLASLSGELRLLSLELIRISGDLRLLGSGPNTGLSEILLPAVQPGSSMMPGKVNPSLAEMLAMVCFQVIGHDSAISFAAQAGQLELNVMLPLIAEDLLDSISLLSKGCESFRKRCLEGIEANKETCAKNFEESLGLATVLAPELGYALAAELAQRAQREGRRIREIVENEKILEAEKIDLLFS